MIGRIRGAPERALATVVFVALWAATAVNALWLQKGSHPAPLVQHLPWEQTQAAVQAPAPAREITPDPLVREVQEALASRGFYRGQVDGLYGPGTRAAIESFQASAGATVDGQATAALLALVQLADVEAPPLPPQAPDLEGAESEVAATTGAAAPGDQATAQGEPRIVHVQRVLADLGYAPGPIDGQWGRATSAALKRFQEDRGIAATGEIGPEVLAELSRVSGVEVD